MIKAHVRFGELFLLPQKNGLTRPKKVRGSGLPMVNMGELFANSRIRNIEMDLVPIAESEKAFLLEKGDLLFARQSLVRDGAGQCSIFLGNTEPTVFESHIIRCRLNPEIAEPEFYYYLFKSPRGREAIDAIIEQGAGAAGIRGSDLVNIQLPYLPIVEQRRVAQTLSGIDDKIDLLLETNITLEATARAFFKSWFVDFDPVHAKADGREPEGVPSEIVNRFPSEFADSLLGRIPKGWNAKSIGTIADIVKGKSYASSDLVEQSETALVSLKSFARGGGFRLNGFKPYSGKYKAEQIVKAGDLIVAYTDVTQNADVIGKPAIVVGVEKYSTLVASLDVGIVRPKPEEASVEYLYGIFCTLDFQAHTYAHTSGTTVLHLSKDAIQSYIAAVPPFPIIKAFEKLVVPFRLKAQENIIAIQQLESLRDTLLSRLMSGQLRPMETCA